MNGSGAMEEWGRVPRLAGSRMPATDGSRNEITRRRKAWGDTVPGRLGCTGLGEGCAQVEWPLEAGREVANWKELWALGRVLAHWGGALKDKPVLTLMDEATAATYANYAAGKSSGAAAVARGIMAREPVLT